MRAPDSHKEKEIAKYAHSEQQGSAAQAGSSHQDQSGREQERNRHELKRTPCRQQYRMAEKYSQSFRPALPHGAKSAVHSGAHQAGAMTKPDTMTRLFKNF